MPLNKKTKTSLPQKTAIKLRDRIKHKGMLPGDKLPTEPNLMTELGVSRTVLREAIATLKAEGLVEAKQGVGVFIATPKKALPSLLSKSTQTLTDTIEALELRAAVEVEAVALAIARCSIAQEAEIYRCFDIYERKSQSGESAEQEDFEFHLSIAKATNNQHFVDFLEVLGRRTIPRARLREEAGLPRDLEIDKYLNSEHKAILEAIGAREIEAAQQAMRDHLLNGCERYRKLMREIERSKS
ncbi:FadR/GntR family transcriptional regulator [Marinomonas transparens]|uniref:FadR family transcriptional regulator n=1 Tax=Marinomonas transparens TaxID=2795388 RepID=A0A934JRY0_9GAMM|nr:FadR/GntR family transcriptional regulator [Marinomonas transparens]MBJ7537257.1 FadR family transcriptional regulator [Marinomonas transparens]